VHVSPKIIPFIPYRRAHLGVYVSVWNVLSLFRNLRVVVLCGFHLFLRIIKKVGPEGLDGKNSKLRPNE
jgi:hypothetical protein